MHLQVLNAQVVQDKLHTKWTRTMKRMSKKKIALTFRDDNHEKYVISNYIYINTYKLLGFKFLPLHH